MTTPLTTDWGEEWYTDNNVDGATVTVGLYNDSTDAASETFDVAAVTSEPSGSAYARQSTTVSTGTSGGEYGLISDSQVSFDVSDSSQTIDAAFAIVSFQSGRAGDGSATDHVIFVDGLSATYDLSSSSSPDTININAGDLSLLSD